ncbi:hypothetical protein HTS88_18280 [Pseudarthrobacter oxydans]|uniref:hypothetical protein n=1 Tax=Pseudarthrobacter oxydans TaxID=1671 RepID=UPI001574950E|nr:hypothetical protein [Pseudarthrobacter oxydans]NSX38335.1 hypothetical protein [Pseudarthrobacter oxydans]
MCPRKKLGAHRGRVGAQAGYQIPFEEFAAVLRQLRKNEQVIVQLLNGRSTTGSVDLVSLNADLLWLHTHHGRQMFLHEDVRDITKSAPDTPKKAETLRLGRAEKS